MPNRPRSHEDLLPAVLLSEIFALAVFRIEEATRLVLVCKGWKRLLRESRLSPAHPYHCFDAVLADVAVSFPCLRTLNLAWCSKITDAGMQTLAKHCAGLRRLNLSYCRNITDAGMPSLAKLTNLQQLNLTDCVSITDTGLKSLATLTGLQHLNFSWCYKITDAGLQSLAILTDLRKLNLKGCRHINDAGLQLLATLTHLQTLNLSFQPDLGRWSTKITDVGLEALRRSLPDTDVRLNNEQWHYYYNRAPRHRI